MNTTVLLVPGLMNDAWVWSMQLAALSRFAPVMVASNDGLDDLGAMAERLLEATNGPLFVAGHSMGGRVALEMVARAPDRIARLALLSTGAHGRRDSENEGRMKLVELARSHGMDAAADAWLPDMMSPTATAEARRQVRAMLLRSSPAIFADQQKALLNRPDRTALLETIRVPVLVATGEHDGWASPDQHRAMAVRIPGSQLEIVAGSGHMLPVEAAGKVTDMLMAFFFATDLGGR